MGYTNYKQLTDCMSPARVHIHCIGALFSKCFMYATFTCVTHLLNMRFQGEYFLESYEGVDVDETSTDGRKHVATLAKSTLNHR